MSYVVAIWEQPPNLPLPGDIRAATRLIDLLYGVAPGANPKYAALVERLTARYPDITSPEAEALDQEQWAWIDGPLAASGPDAVYNLGLNLPMLDKVRPFVIETANGLGLNVFDGQAAEVHFADGTAMKSYDRRRTGFEDALVERLRPVLAARGFEPGPDASEFTRRVDAGWHRIFVFVAETWPPHYEFVLDARHENYAIDRLYTQICSPGTAWQPGDKGPLGIVPQGRWIERGRPFVTDKGVFRVTGEAQLDLVVPAIAAQVDGRLLPLLEQADTPSGYDALMNPAVLSESIFFIDKTFHGWERGYRNVLAAHLAGNPRILEICDAIEQGLEGEPPWSTVFFNTRKCVDHVRRERGIAWGRPR